MEPRRFGAYYFGFSETNQPEINKVLSAICYAGKGYHHTEGWVEPVSDYGDFCGGSYEAWIQNAANEAAQRIKQLEDALRDMGEALEFYGDVETYDREELSHGFCAIFNSIKNDHERMRNVSTPKGRENLSSYGGKRAREALSRNKGLLEEINKEKE